MRKHLARTFWAVCMSLGIGAAAGISDVHAQGKGGECKPSFNAPDRWLIRHDPHGTSLNTGVFTLNVSNAGDLRCNGRIRVTSTEIHPYLNAESGGQRVRYSLYDQRTNFNVTPPESSAHPLGSVLQVERGGVQGNAYGFDVHPNENLRAGLYSHYVTFEYITPNDKTVLASKTVLLSYEVAASVRIGLKGEYSSPGGLRTINLGELQDRDYRPMTFVTVDSTRGYLLSVTSENKGYLRHDETNWTIPYSLMLGNISVDLKKKFEYSRASSIAVNDEYPLVFMVRDTANKRAGRYKDILNFTVTAI